MAIIEVDGDLWDDETGEYAGPVSKYIDGAADTEEKVLQVMRKHMDLVADIEATKIKHEAILANIKSEMARKESKLDWLLRMYSADLDHYVQNALPRDSEGALKVKTWSCPWGKISFRTTPKRTVVTDADNYVQWCLDNAKINLLKIVPVASVVPDDAPYTATAGGDEKMSIKIK